MSNDKTRSDFESSILNSAAWMTFERDPDDANLYQDTEVHCAWLGYLTALAQQASVEPSKHAIDWPPCNPGCEYEDPHGGIHDYRSASCSCDAAKCSMAKQLAQQSSEPIEIKYPENSTSIDAMCKIIKFFGIEKTEYTDSTILYEVTFDQFRAIYNLGKDHAQQASEVQVSQPVAFKVIETNKNNGLSSFHYFVTVPRMCEIENEYYTFEITPLHAQAPDYEALKHRLKVAEKLSSDSMATVKKSCVACNGIGKVLIHDSLIGMCSDCNGSGKEPLAAPKGEE
jgi:hypothetical protein